MAAATAQSRSCRVTAQGQTLFSAAWEDTGPGIRLLDVAVDSDPTEQVLRIALCSEVVWIKIGLSSVRNL